MASTGNQGVILGDDGGRYTFTPAGWRDPSVRAVAGMRVDFEARDAHAVSIYPVPGAVPTASSPIRLRGSILNLVGDSGQGMILGDDGSQYALTPADWGNRSVRPAVGMRVTFVGYGSLATSVHPEQDAVPNPRAMSPVTPGQMPPQTAATVPTVAAPPRPRTLSRPSTAGARRTPPVPATPTPWYRGRLATLIAMVVVGISALGIFVYLQQPRTDEEIAESVAKKWVGSRNERVSEIMTGLLVTNLPVFVGTGRTAILYPERGRQIDIDAMFVTPISGRTLTDRVRDKIDWSYSAADCSQVGRCNITVTATAVVDVKVRGGSTFFGFFSSTGKSAEYAVVKDTATMKLAYDLGIDTVGRRVLSWEADIRSASMSSVEQGHVSISRSARQSSTAASSDRYIIRAVDRLREFVAKGDIHGTPNAAAGALR